MKEANLHIIGMHHCPRLLLNNKPIVAKAQGGATGRAAGRIRVAHDRAMRTWYTSYTCCVPTGRHYR
jgi:hypothetical protein